MHEFVYTDRIWPSYWDYNSDEKTYYRYKLDGSFMNKIKGENLPDPWLLWQKRAEINSTTPTGPNGKTYKPQEATFRIWDHWQSVKK